MAKRKITGHMSGNEYRAILEWMGLPCNRAGRGKIATFFDISESTASRRIDGTTPIPWETAALLRLIRSMRRVHALAKLGKLMPKDADSA